MVKKSIKRCVYPPKHLPAGHPCLEDLDRGTLCQATPDRMWYYDKEVERCTVSLLRRNRWQKYVLSQLETIQYRTYTLSYAVKKHRQKELRCSSSRTPAAACHTIFSSRSNSVWTCAFTRTSLSNFYTQRLAPNEAMENLMYPLCTR